jgi:hypothetical protein
MERFYRIDSDTPGPYWLLVEASDATGEEWKKLSVRCQATAPDMVVHLEVRRAGDQSDVFVTPLGTLVVGPAAAQLLRSCCRVAVQLLSCQVPGVDIELYAVNILAEYDCLDPAKSLVIGQSRLIPNLKYVARAAIDPSRVGPAAIFHVKGISPCVIREELKTMIESIGSRGVRLKRCRAPRVNEPIEAAELNRLRLHMQRERP